MGRESEEEREESGEREGSRSLGRDGGGSFPLFPHSSIEERDGRRNESSGDNFLQLRLPLKCVHFIDNASGLQECYRRVTKVGGAACVLRELICTLWCGKLPARLSTTFSHSEVLLLEWMLSGGSQCAMVEWKGATYLSSPLLATAFSKPLFVLFSFPPSLPPSLLPSFPPSPFLLSLSPSLSPSLPPPPHSPPPFLPLRMALMQLAVAEAVFLMDMVALPQCVPHSDLRKFLHDVFGSSSSLKLGWGAFSTKICRTTSCSLFPSLPLSSLLPLHHSLHHSLPPSPSLSPFLSPPSALLPLRAGYSIEGDLDLLIRSWSFAADTLLSPVRVVDVQTLAKMVSQVM